MGQVLVYVTASSEEEARAIARDAVGRRLAACANVLGAIASVYRWEGEVREDSEVALILKTRSDRVEALVDAVRSMHSYSEPCVVAVPVVAGSPGFLSWIDEEAAPDDMETSRSPRGG